MVYIRSPHFEKDPHNDGHDHEAFLVTTREIKAGEELLWPYNASQHYRSLAPEPASPSHLTPPTSSKAHKKAVPNAVCVSASQAVPTVAARKKADVAASVSAAQAADALVAAVPTTASRKRTAVTASVSAAQAADARVAAVPTASRKRTAGGLYDPDCKCPDQKSKCKLGYCWFLGGRVVESRRRLREPTHYEP